MAAYQKRARNSKESACAPLQQQMPMLFPMIELLEQAKLTIRKTTDQLNQLMFELVVEASAENVASPRAPGASNESSRWYGMQPDVITLEDRKLRLIKPQPFR